MTLTLYETIVILFFGALALAIAAYKMGQQKSDIKHLRERIDKLESEDTPIGYKRTAGIEEGQAYILAARRALEAANEYLNAVKRDGYNPDPGKW